MQEITTQRELLQAAEQQLNDKEQELAEMRLVALQTEVRLKELEQELLDRLPRSVQGAPTTMRLPVEHTLAISDFDLAAVEAADGLRRRTLVQLRALFSEALAST